jgi:hypothetical protein
MVVRVACMQKYRAETVQRDGRVVFFLPDQGIEFGFFPASKERGEAF